MHAYAAPRAYPNPAPYAWRPPYNPYYNPARVWWIVGGVLVVGGAIAATAYVFARREAAAPSPAAPGEVLDPSQTPTDPEQFGQEGVGFGEFPQGEAPAQAELFYKANKAAIRRVMFILLDAEAKKKGIQPGWQSPKKKKSGPPWQFEPADEEDDEPLGFTIALPPPDKGPEHWSQDDVWEMATDVMESVFGDDEYDFDTYPDIAEWASVVSEDGPVDAWLKGSIAAKLMELTQADPEPVDGEEIDWTQFLVPN